MALPPNFIATNTKDNIDGYWYLEIEGIQHRWGTFNPSWNPADTGTNQHIFDWISEIPEIRGQRIEPLNGSTTPHEWSVTILDVGDALTALFSVHDSAIKKTVMTADINKAAVTLTVADSSVFTIPSNIYVDRETMRATAAPTGTTLTVTRGMYGSKDVDHKILDSEGNTKVLVEVTSAPRFFHTREVKLYESREGLAEADGIFLRGILDDYQPNKDGEWTITATGQLKRLAAEIGWEMARSYLRETLWGGTYTHESYNVYSSWRQSSRGQTLAPSGYQGENSQNYHFTSWCIAIEDQSDFESSGYVVIDEELIRYVAKENAVGGQQGLQNPDVDLLKMVDLTVGPGDYGVRTLVPYFGSRGMLSSDIFGSRGFTRISPGDENLIFFYAQKPIFMDWHIVEPDADRGPEVRQVFALVNVDPVVAILQLLLSGGEGGTYDVLPQGWGLGLDEDNVDIAGMLVLRDKLQLNGQLLILFIDKPVNCKKFIEENLLRPFLLFMTEQWDGKIGLGTLYSKEQAIAEGAVLDITKDVWLDPGPSLSPGKPPIGELIIKCNHYPPQKKFYGEFRAMLGESNDRYLGTARKFEIEARSIYDSRVGTGENTRTSNSLADLPNPLVRYLQTIWNRFGLYPMPIVQGPVAYNRMSQLVAGAIVRISHSTLPNVKTGSRGLTNEYFQVMETSPNPENSGLDLVLWQIGVHDDNHRRIAPSAVVFAYAAAGGAGGVPRVTLRNDVYSDTNQNDVSYFRVGDFIKFVNADYHDIDVGETHEIKAVAATTVDLVTTPTTPPVQDDIMDTAPYDDCVAVQVADWCYMADANDVLGAADDEGHVRA